jgi:hypothetical protein
MVELGEMCVKKVLILLFCTSLILLGCSNASSNENSQEKSTESAEKKKARDFLVMIFDDTFKKMTSEISNFTSAYFKPLYDDGKSVNLMDYIEANKQLKKAVETEKKHMDELQKDLDLSEYENQDEVSDILQLQMDLIESANAYSLATENWITAEGENSKKYLDEAYNAIEEFGNKSEEYSGIIDKYNSEILSKTELGSNSGDNKTEIRLTSEEKDGTHYWKGNNELVTGHDWISLTEEEKKKLILLDKEHLDSSLNITLEKSSEEYVELMNNYFSDEPKLDDTIKDVLTNYTIEDIQNKNQ